MKIYLRCGLLCLACNITLLSCSARASKPPSVPTTNIAVPSKEQLPVVDNSRTLVSQLDSAIQFYGESGPIVFERLTDLLDFLAQSKKHGLITERKDQIKKLFTTLLPVEQQYFVPQLLALSTAEVRQTQYLSANAIYAPVLTTNEKTQWQNKGEISKLLVRLAFELGERNQNIDAEAILQLGCQLSNSTSIKNQRAYHDLAMLHIKMKRYDEASVDMEKMIHKDLNQCSCEDLVSLAKLYEKRNDSEKLKDLTRWILIRIRTTQGDKDFSQLSQLVSSYLSLGLNSQATEIITDMDQHALETSLSFETQYSMMQTALTVPEKGNYQKEAPIIYKGWTNLVKKHYGANSKEFFSSMSCRLSVCRSNLNDQQVALVEQEIKRQNIVPGGIEQRLILLNLLGQFSPQNKGYVVTTLDLLNQQVPNGKETSTFFTESASLYNRLDAIQAGKISRDRAINAICSKLDASNSWLLPFIQHLKIGPRAKSSNESSIISSMQDINRSIDENSRTNLEGSILGALAKRG